MSLYFRIVNPIVRGILHSPFHNMMSHNTMMLSMRGRKSGKPITTPVSYHEPVPNEIHCFTALQGRWWRNLTEGSQCELQLRGRTYQASALIERGDQADIADALTEFLRAVPRDAPHSGVRLLENGEPDPEDINREAKTHVLVRLILQAT
ncbi:MAG: hypothetical protein KDI36_10685 [Pseudomonadales bacterium]|nr:hypothetical protein [Pseudomonadales bacterium]